MIANYPQHLHCVAVEYVRMFGCSSLGSVFFLSCQAVICTRSLGPTYFFSRVCTAVLTASDTSYEICTKYEEEKKGVVMFAVGERPIVRCILGWNIFYSCFLPFCRFFEILAWRGHLHQPAHPPTGAATPAHIVVATPVLLIFVCAISLSRQHGTHSYAVPDQ